jgi:hypothetical protein
LNASDHSPSNHILSLAINPQAIHKSQHSFDCTMVEIRRILWDGSREEELVVLSMHKQLQISDQFVVDCRL